MTINHIDIIRIKRNMSEHLLSHITTTVPSHLSIPIGLLLPGSYEGHSNFQENEEDTLIDNLFDIATIDMKKMDHLFQQVCVQPIKSNKGIETRKTKKRRKS